MMINFQQQLTLQIQDKATQIIKNLTPQRFIDHQIIKKISKHVL